MSKGQPAPRHTGSSVSGLPTPEVLQGLLSFPLLLRHVLHSRPWPWALWCVGRDLAQTHPCPGSEALVKNLLGSSLWVFSPDTQGSLKWVLGTQLLDVPLELDSPPGSECGHLTVWPEPGRPTMQSGVS